MIHVLISGIVLGMTISFMIGPSFFSLLQTSINKGFKIGMFMAMGIFLSDFTLVALSYLGVSQVITLPKYQMAFGLIGGAILIGYGIYTFRKKNNLTETNEKDTEMPKIKLHSVILTYFVKGYFLNLANPFLLISWMGIMGYASASFGDSHLKTVLFFAGTLLTIFAIDLTKCFIANRIKQYLRPIIIKLINHILGVVLIGFGVYLIGKTIYFNWLVAYF
jgi:threonine/homoserine/homoserine lactone efflux protein